MCPGPIRSDGQNAGGGVFETDSIGDVPPRFLLEPAPRTSDTYADLSRLIGLPTPAVLSRPLERSQSAVLARTAFFSDNPLADIQSLDFAIAGAQDQSSVLVQDWVRLRVLRTLEAYHAHKAEIPPPLQAILRRDLDTSSRHLSSAPPIDKAEILLKGIGRLLALQEFDLAEKDLHEVFSILDARSRSPLLKRKNETVQQWNPVYTNAAKAFRRLNNSPMAEYIDILRQSMLQNEWLRRINTHEESAVKYIDGLRKIYETHHRVRVQEISIGYHAENNSPLEGAQALPMDLVALVQAADNRLALEARLAQAAKKFNDDAPQAAEIRHFSVTLLEDVRIAYTTVLDRVEKRLQSDRPVNPWARQIALQLLDNKALIGVADRLWNAGAHDSTLRNTKYDALHAKLIELALGDVARERAQISPFNDGVDHTQLSGELAQATETKKKIHVSFEDALWQVWLSAKSDIEQGLEENALPKIVYVFELVSNSDLPPARRLHIVNMIIEMATAQEWRELLLKASLYRESFNSQTGLPRHVSLGFEIETETAVWMVETPTDAKRAFAHVLYTEVFKWYQRALLHFRKASKLSDRQPVNLVDVAGYVDASYQSILQLYDVMRNNPQMHQYVPALYAITEVWTALPRLGEVARKLAPQLATLEALADRIEKTAENAQRVLKQFDYDGPEDSSLAIARPQEALPNLLEMAEKPDVAVRPTVPLPIPHLATPDAEAAVRGTSVTPLEAATLLASEAPPAAPEIIRTPRPRRRDSAGYIDLAPLLNIGRKLKSLLGLNRDRTNAPQPLQLALPAAVVEAPTRVSAAFVSAPIAKAAAVEVLFPSPPQESPQFLKIEPELGQLPSGKELGARLRARLNERAAPVEVRSEISDAISKAKRLAKIKGLERGALRVLAKAQAIGKARPNGESVLTAVEIRSIGKTISEIHQIIRARNPQATLTSIGGQMPGRALSYSSAKFRAPLKRHSAVNRAAKARIIAGLKAHQQQQRKFVLAAATRRSLAMRSLSGGSILARTYSVRR